MPRALFVLGLADFGYGFSFTLLQPDTLVSITRLGVYLPTNSDDCEYTLSIYDQVHSLHRKTGVSLNAPNASEMRQKNALRKHGLQA